MQVAVAALTLLAAAGPLQGQGRATGSGINDTGRTAGARFTDTNRTTGSTKVAQRPLRLAPLRVCAGGDVTLGTNLDTAWAVRNSARFGVRIPALPDPAALLRPLRPLVEDADFLLLNVEGAIGEGPFEPKCGPNSTNCYAFRQPVSAAAAMRALGAGAEVIGNIANNHAGDAGPVGRLQTIAHLQAAGVHVTGADTIATVVVSASGDTIAFLGFSTSAGPDPRDLAAVRRHVARAAERHRRVVVTTHMGAEGAAAQRTMDSTERFLNLDRGNPVAFARAAVEAGADLVIGHGPHVMRAVEWRGDALVMYSLGNLVTYGPFSYAEPMNRGAIACALLGPEGRVESAAIRSTVQAPPPGRVSIDPSGRAAFLVDSLSRLDVGAGAPAVRVEAVLLRPAEATPPLPAASPND